MKTVVVGRHDDEGSYAASQFFMTMRNATEFESEAALRQVCEESDLIIHNSYTYSNRARPGIEELCPCLTSFGWFKELKAFKLLVDGESFAGQMKWHRAIAPLFDGIAGLSPDLGLYIHHLGVDDLFFKDLGYGRDVDVAFVGPYMQKGDRKQLAGQLKTVCGRRGWRLYLGGGLHPADYIALLNRSRVVVCLYSTAGESGLKGRKDKAGRAALCGAAPLTDSFDDALLQAGSERFVMGDLEEQLSMALEDEALRTQVVEAAKKRVLPRFTSHGIWEQVLEYYLPQALVSVA